MNIIWIVNDVLKKYVSKIDGDPSIGGSWIDPLFSELRKNKKIKLGVITPVVGSKFTIYNFDGIKYYTIPIIKGDNKKFLKREYIKHYINAINDFKPEIIHFHGTENNFGLLRKYVNSSIPMVGSIQGIIDSYLPYLKMSTSGFNYRKYRSFKNWLGKGGIDSRIKQWQKYSAIEKEIFSSNQHYIGRTLWDKAQVHSLNPYAHYYHGEELLRDAFYKSKWDIKNCKRYSIFISSGAYAIKGLHVFLQAINLLKNKYPKIRVFVPLFYDKKSTIKNYLFGEDYSNYIKSLVRKFELRSHIIFLERLNENEMASQFTRSHIFVLPSFIENSPNSLGEAMMTGTPSIVSYAGGVDSIVENEQSALMFPTGDFRTLAHQIDQLFSNDELAIKLSKNARRIAEQRHDKVQIPKQYVNIYNSIIKDHHESSSPF